MSEELKKLVLDKRKEGKVVYWPLPDQMVSANLSDFIRQPADGILWDLNRLEETVFTFMDDPKWVNDFAVALTIRALKDEIERLAGLMNDVANCGVELNDERISYVVVQIDRPLWDSLKDGGR